MCERERERERERGGERSHCLVDVRSQNQLEIDNTGLSTAKCHLNLMML